MHDNITLKKLWQDDEVIQLRVMCSSSVAMAISEIYVSDSLIDKLIYQINQFLNGNVEEASWENESRGDTSTACVAFRFLKKDRLGHVFIETFMELDDGGKYTEHNSCFFVNTEYGLLMKFCESLTKLKTDYANYEVCLNEF